MSLTLSLQPDLEARIEQEANREGMSPAQVVVRALDARRFASAPAHAAPLLELDILLQPGAGLSEGFWDQYRSLRDRLEPEELTHDEYVEFTHLHAVVEAKNVQRISLLLQIAQVRGVTLPEVMEQLGVGSLQVP